MDDKIKAKAQEVRLALLDRLHRTLECIMAQEDELERLSEAAGILNQLDPGAGIGSYATAIDPQELGGHLLTGLPAYPDFKVGDVLILGTAKVKVRHITPDGDGDGLNIGIVAA